MESQPCHDQRKLISSPPPSRTLLELQKQGFEFSVSPTASDHLQARHASARSTPSDLDKPLPLEPFDKQRRSSSVYSTDTTITNIIHLYGGHRELEDLPDLPPLPPLHQPQAYRDTVAPLLIKRLSLASSLSSRLPTPPPPRPRPSISSISLRSTAKKTAPSFVEFSRALQDRRKELVSPLSSASDHHRQAAYDQLAPPSAQISAVELSIAVGRTPPLPDAMSVTISDVAESELLPSPPDLRNMSPPSPLYKVPGQISNSGFAERSQTEISCASSQQAYRDRHWSENWLEDDFSKFRDELATSDVSEQELEDSRSATRRGETSFREDQDQILAPMTFKDETRKSRNPERKSQRSSKRSSLQQGVNDLLRTLSITKRRDSRKARAHENVPRERQLAIQPTPYQLYGDQIWSTKKSKTSGNNKVGHKRGKSMDLVAAYQSGQSQLVSVLEGAKQKLTRKTSQRRRRKLKQSIILVGPSPGPGKKRDDDVQYRRYTSFQDGSDRF